MHDVRYTSVAAFRSAVRHGLKIMGASALATVTKSIAAEVKKNDEPATGKVTHKIAIGKSVIRYTNFDGQQESFDKNQQKFNEIVMAGQEKFKELL